MKRFFCFIFLFSLGKFAFSQFPNVLISTSNSPEEVSIAINPKNTNQIVAGANLNNSYRSNDAGATWTISTITCPAYSVWGDPVLIWDTSNACYFIHLSNPNPTITPGGSWIDRIVIQKSNNFGQIWSTCTATGKNGSKGQDKAWPVVNPYNNEIHLTWTQFDNYGTTNPADSSIILHSKSSDAGNTWSAPLRISFYAGDCVDSDSTLEGAVPAIGPLGEVYCSWASKKGLMFQKSTNGGVTWLPQEKFINTIPGGWDYNISGIQRCNGLPFTYCDLSNGPYKGTIYINWSDQRNGVNDGDIWLVKSTDGGNNWSAPFRVNDDVPGKQQFLSAMAVDQITGYVYIVFYDRRNFAAGTSTDVYLAISKDGGGSFVNYKINANTFAPSAAYFFGDYIHIAAHNNVIRPIWMQMTGGGALSVYTALVNPIVLGIDDAKKENLSLVTVRPNPFTTETEIDFGLERKTKLTIQIVDNTGRIVNEIAKGKEFSKGNHTLNINAQRYNLSSGMYYLVFYGDEKSKFTKLILE